MPVPVGGGRSPGVGRANSPRAGSPGGRRGPGYKMFQADSAEPATRDVSNALASGLAHLLDEAVEGPLQRAFQEIDMRFTELADVNDELMDRIGALEAQNGKLAAELKGVPLADEIARLEDDNHRLTEELARERQERIAETDEVTMLLKQLQIFSESLDSRAAMQRRHRVESTMRATLARMRKSTMAKAWGAWHSEYTRKRRVQGQKRKAMQRFRYRWVATTFQTWVSWTRVEVKNKLMADQGAGSAFEQLKEQLEVEVAQRHFEVEEINKVMKQLHLVVASVDDSRVRERAHAIETRLRKTLGHMAHGKLSLAWKGWSSFLLRQRRKKNLLSKAASKMLHRTMVDCFKSWMTATVQCNAERKLLLDEEQAKKILQLEALMHRQTDGIEDLVKETVAENYYLLEQGRRQAVIERHMRKAQFLFKNKLIGAAFNTWKGKHLRKRRIRNMTAKAGRRFLNVHLAKAFEPWAAKARQTTRDKHEANVISLFEDVQAMTRRLEDDEQGLEALRLIFNPNGPVFQAGVAL